MEWRHRELAKTQEEAMEAVADYLATALLEGLDADGCESYCAKWSIPFSRTLHDKLIGAHNDRREDYGWSSSSCW